VSRYTKKHYEDVARLINESWPLAVPEDVNEVILFSLANKFADLFAADNPPICTAHRPGQLFRSGPCTSGCLLQGSFNRDKFLSACGLEPVKETH